MDRYEKLLEIKRNIIQLTKIEDKLWDRLIDYQDRGLHDEALYLNNRLLEVEEDLDYWKRRFKEVGNYEYEDIY